jgi:hypothetical protein
MNGYVSQNLEKGKLIIIYALYYNEHRILLI